ncbi:UNVERIFIED_CONTAM: hypothetical protein K2H54_039459 [Gekko kuhli]
MLKIAHKNSRVPEYTNCRCRGSLVVKRGQARELFLGVWVEQASTGSQWQWQDPSRDLQVEQGHSAGFWLARLTTSQQAPDVVVEQWRTEDDEKLKKRKERFGIVTSSAGAGTTEDTEAKKRKRAERFGLV